MNRASVPPAWEAARRILCVRLDSLGDVLMCTPAIRALKHARPGRHISLLTSNSGAALAPFIPDIDATICYAAPWMKHGQPHGWRDDLVMADQLRAGQYDAAVIFTSCTQSALPAAMLAYLADIPLRLAHCRENAYRLLSDWLPEQEPQQAIRHEVQRQLDLVASVGCHTARTRLTFTLRENDRRTARSKLAQHDIDFRRPLLLLHAGATASSRRYPPPLWSEVIRQLHQMGEFQFALTGDAGEADLVDTIIAGSGVSALSLAGHLSLGELGAVISMASVMISNNTGPAHMAAAIGTPLVDLYALTNPQHTPWQVAHRVLFHDVPCRYCYKSICPQGHQDCLRKVAPADVVAAVSSLLKAGAHAGTIAASTSSTPLWRMN